MRDDPPLVRAAFEALTKEPRFVIWIEMPVGSIYVTSHGDITGVPGVVLHGCLSEPTVVTQKLNPREARAEIGSASFRLVDVGSQFTAQIRAQLALGAGIRRRRVRFYVGLAGWAFADFRLFATHDLTGVRFEKGAYSVECADIQRSARKEVFTPAQTTLAQTLDASGTTVFVENAAGFERVKHGPSYTDAPGQTVGYLRIKDEWIRYTGTSGNSFTGCTRGVFGTTPGTHEVDVNTPAARREKVTEGIYLELPGPKLMYALLTGVLHGDSATLPAHWHLGIPTSLIRLADYTGIGTDLWDPADDTRGIVLRFLGLTKIDGKRFYETEILRLLGLFAPVYADGTLGLKRMTRVLGDAAPVATLDESNTVSVGALDYDMGSLQNSFTIEWNPAPDGKSFTRSLTLLDANSVTTHGLGEDTKLSFRGLWGGRHTDALIYRLIDGLRDRYAAPPLELSVDVLHGLNRVEPGDVVRAKYQHVRDPAGSVPGIDRAFEIQGATINHRTGKVALQLFGSTAPAAAIAPTQSVAALPDGFYSSAGTPLGNVVPITGGVASTGTYNLTGGTDLTAAPSIFYHLGDLTIPQGTTLSLTGNVQLRVRGYLTLNGIISGVGGGHVGVVDVAGTQPAGRPGFVGHSRGWDGIDVKRDFQNGPPEMNTVPAQLTRAVHSAFPYLALDVVGTTLRGLPTDLRGTGGPPGGRITGSNGATLHALGGSGGSGGAGLAIISRGFGLGASASINLSGTSSPATIPIWPDFRNSYAAGPGGAGGPGALLVLLDGSLLSAPDFSGKFIANTGSVTLPSSGLPPPSELKFLENEPARRYPSNTGVWMGHKSPDVISGWSLAGSALRIQYLAPEQTPSLDVARRPPPPTGASVTSDTLGIAIDLTLPDATLYDMVEVWASIDNNRANAARIAAFRGSAFVHKLPGAVARWYWFRTVNGKNEFGVDNASAWLPTTTTSLYTATSGAAGAGPPGDSIYVQYSVDGSTGWHDPPFQAGDKFMRQRVGAGGAWGPAIKIVGEDGDDGVGSPGPTGNYVDVIFVRAAAQPPTPTGDNPAGWSDAPPAPNVAGDPLWASWGERTAAGALQGAWSAPVRIEGLSARSVSLASTDQAFRFNAANQGDPTSQTITLTAQRQSINANGLTWSVETSSGSFGGWASAPGNGDTAQVNLASFGANDWLRITVAATDNAAIRDRVTIYRLRGGNSGTNLLDPTQWKVGTSGSQGAFGENANAAGENVIVLGGAGGEPLGPSGASEPLWKSVNVDAGGEDPDGGWNVGNVAIDHRKAYRLSVWIRTDANSGSRYFGPAADWFHGEVVTNDLNGAPNGNPCFLAASPAGLGMEVNRWFLLVGVVHGSGYTGGPSGLTGVYDTEGRRVSGGVEFKNKVGATRQGHRTYSYYAESSATWWARPRVDELNGSEPSLADLIQSAPSTLGTSLRLILDNEVHAVPADAAGNVTSYGGASGQARAWYGTTDVTALCSWSLVANPQGLTYAGSSPLNATNGSYAINGGLDAGEDVATMTIRASYVTPGGITVTDDRVFSLTKARRGVDGDDGLNGAPGLTHAISKASHSVPCDAAGVPKAGAYTGASGTFRVWSGSIEVTSSCAFASTASNVTGSVSNAAGTKGQYSVSALLAETGYLDMTATYGGVIIPARFSLQKVRDGSASSSARDETIGAITNSVYVEIGGPISIAADAGGTLRCSAGVSYDIYPDTNTSPSAATIKIQYREAGGTWIDFPSASAVGSGAYYNSGDMSWVYGGATIAEVSTGGPSVPKVYEFRLLGLTDGSVLTVFNGALYASWRP